MALPDYYAILEVSPRATADEIRAAYRRLALRWHPDQARDGGTPEKFFAVKEAYETLRVPERRRAYDETRFFRASLVKPQPKSAKAGRAALSWVDHFFIQAGGIEAEGPGKGTLRRYTVGELEAIWSAITGRLVQHGEVRQSIRQFELLSHYIRRHPELVLPKRGGERVEEKRVLLNELETLRKGTTLAWDRAPLSLEDFLRRQRYADARSLLIWRAAHAMVEKLTAAGLFEAIDPGGVPAKELAMIDRLEAISAGETPVRRLGHGYVACRRCGAWAMNWGVAAPHCAHCGYRRFVLRPRDERDDWLASLIGRHVPAFWRQFNVRNAAVQQGLERWVWAPLFLLLLLTAIMPAVSAGSQGLTLLAQLLFATGWWCGAWSVADRLPGDTDMIYPDEWDAARAAGVTVRFVAVVLLAAFAVTSAVQERFLTAGIIAIESALVYAGPVLQEFMSRRPRSGR